MQGLLYCSFLLLTRIVDVTLNPYCSNCWQSWHQSPLQSCVVNDQTRRVSRSPLYSTLSIGKLSKTGIPMFRHVHYIIKKTNFMHRKLFVGIFIFVGIYLYIYIYIYTYLYIYVVTCLQYSHYSISCYPNDLDKTARVGPTLSTTNWPYD